MEKKILHTFRTLNSLFFEARFIFAEPGKAPAPEAGKAEEEPKKEEEKKPDLGEKKEEVKKESEGEKAKLKEQVKGRGKRSKFKEEEHLPDTAEVKPIEKKEEVKVPESLSINSDEFLKRDAAEQTNNLDWFRINGTRENSKINAQTWDHSTKEGLQKIYQDFRDLDIVGKDAKDRAYYDTMFAILKGGADFSEGNTAYAGIFKSPTDGTSRETLAGLQPKGSFKGGEAYLRAFDALTLVKARLMIQERKQGDTLKAQGKKGVDPIGTAAVDFVKSNLGILQKAAKDRDYATLGIYAVGAYALWETLGSKLFGGDGGHGGGEHGAHGGINWKNWALIGAAVYGADKLLKNAGYDALKIAGFKGMDAEVKGTPLEVMNNILSKPEYNDEFKDLDYGIALTMSETKLTDLNKLVMDANKSGIHFIHPREFPALFPDLKAVWPFKMGIGEQGLKDYVGMNNAKLSGAEREYIRVGQQLYKLALAMPVVYENTLFKDHDKYKGLTYEKMLQDPVRSKLKVRHLMEAAGQYAPEGDVGGIFSGKRPQEIEEKLRAGTGKVLGENGFTLDTAAELKEGSGHIAGQLKGFPIVLVATKEGYRVYLQSDYSDKKGYNSTPGTKFTLIPLSGAGMERAAQEAVKKVDKRMDELVNVLQGKETQLGKIRFENGQWKCDLKLADSAEAKEFGITATDVTGVINVDENGKGISLNLDKAHGGASINVKEGLKDQHPLLFTLIPRLVNQAEFHALRVFSTTDRLSLKKDKNAPAGVFTLLIGKNKQISADIEYKNGRFEFKDPAAQKEMLKKGSGFKEELKSALGEDDRMAEATKNWEKAISAAPSSYLINFIKHVPDIFTGATLDKPWAGLKLDMVDGSVAKNYAMSLIEAQKGLILAKTANGVDDANSLADVDTQIGKIFNPAIQELDTLSDHFVELTTQHEKDGKNFSEEEFNETVLYKIAEVGIESNDYKSWYAQFTNELFLRYGMNNLRSGNAKKAKDVAKVFVHYTAVLDDKSMDGANLSLSITKETEDYIQRINTAKNDLARAGTANPTDAAIATKVNASLTPATNPLHLPNIVDTDVSSYLDTEATLAKTTKYRTNAKYAEYVAHQIYAKFNDVDAKAVAPSPEDHGFWKIDDYSTWAPSHTQSSHEFIDKNDRVKMNRDYTTLDNYLAMTPAERSRVKKEDVILPRHDYPFEFALKPDGSPVDTDGADLVNKLLNLDANRRIQNFKYTAGEVLFRNKMEALITKIRDKYGKEMIGPAFTKLFDQFTFTGGLDQSKGDHGVEDVNSPTGTPEKRIFHYHFDQTILVDPIDGSVTPYPKKLETEISEFDKTFPQNSMKTITHGNQIAYINNTLENYFEKVVLAEESREKYFDKNSLPKIIKGLYKDIKAWITGN